MTYTGLKEFYMQRNPSKQNNCQPISQTNKQKKKQINKTPKEDRYF